MLLLALDTATATSSVAAVRGRGGPSAARTAEGPRRHAEVLAPMVRDVLDELGAAPADVTEVAVGVGPGMYTGLRVGLVTAAALGHALGVPVVGALSLDVVAHGVAPSAGGRFGVVRAAGRREVFWARYDGAGERTAGPAVGPPGEAAEALGGLAVAGLADDELPELFALRLGADRVAAVDMADLVLARRAAGRGPELPAPVPVYLRRPDVGRAAATVRA